MTKEEFVLQSPNGQIFPFTDRVLIGSTEGCDIISRTPRVSPQHALIAVKDGSAWVSDLGSADGTFVNEHVVGESVRLNEGDQLRFGTELWRFGKRDAGAQKPSAQPRFLLKGPAGKTFRLSQRITVGREPANDVVIASWRVSGFHARITVTGNSAWIDDLQSSNGTYHNDRRISTRVKLGHGDKIRFDTEEWVFSVEETLGIPEEAYSELPVGSQTVFMAPLKPAIPASWIHDSEGKHTVFIAPRPKSAGGKREPGSMYAPFAISPAVHYSVTTGKNVRIGSVFLLDVWAHLAKDADAVRALVERSALDQQIIIHKPNRLLTTIPAGALLEARVRIPDLGMDQWGVIFWNDSIGHAAYIIRVPSATSPGIIPGSVQIAVNEIIFGDVAFEINLSADSRDAPASHYPRQSTKRLKSAFASFAEEDEEQVSTRVQGILVALPDLDLFLDATRIRREPHWNDVLRRELTARDQFYLFWSHAAKASPWVAQEWRTALSLKGIDAIHPVPLASPNDVPPPEELEEIAFKKWKLPSASKRHQRKDDGKDELPNGAKIGHYEILNSLSRGGFGITYRAQDLRLNREIALKEYFPLAYAYRGDDNDDVKPNDNPQDRDLFGWGLIRFRDEAQALARFRHPNILGVMDHIERNSTAYIVTPLESGKTLDRWGAEAAFDEDFLVRRLIMPLVGGLSALHAQGLLHRDIKPQNIIVRDVDSSPVLVDFGSSRLVNTSRAGGDDRPLTTVVSVGYSPPEQHEGGRQGPYTDIYALSATVYHLITGSIPPDATSRLAGADFPRYEVESIRKRVSPTLARAIFAGLDLDPEKRPQSAMDFGGLLARSSNDSGRGNTAAAKPHFLRPIAWGVAGACLFALLTMLAAQYFHWKI